MDWEPWAHWGFYNCRSAYPNPSTGGASTFHRVTILTIVLYVVIDWQQQYWAIPWGPIAKPDEAVLVWLLWSEGKFEMKSTA